MRAQSVCTSVLTGISEGTYRHYGIAAVNNIGTGASDWDTLTTLIDEWT